MEGAFSFVVAATWLTLGIAAALLFFPIKTLLVLVAIITLWAAIRVTKFVIQGD